MLAEPPVIVNGRFRAQLVTGVQRYGIEVTRRLADRTLTLSPAVSLPWGIGHVWEQAVLPLKLPTRALLWSPGGSGPLSVRRHVLTITDVAVLEHPEWYGRAYGRWYGWLWPRLVPRAAAIITISRFSKERIVEVLGVREESVHVTPLGVDASWTGGDEGDREVRAAYDLDRPYLLCVAAVSPRKNFRRVLDAWRTVQRQLDDVSLVIVGKTGLPFSPGRDFDLNVPGVRLLGYVPDSDLGALYRGAVAFVYPSLYEGFGLPVLEAMACGTPVVTSCVTALPEVAGDAAITVDPYSVGEIADALTLIVRDGSLRAALRERGQARARAFSWEACAEKTWQVLSSTRGP
jgi:glycosyltransferase involved in cell wall biosynthesis